VLVEVYLTTQAMLVDITQIIRASSHNEDVVILLSNGTVELGHHHDLFPGEIMLLDRLP
jgi:hypothetical protein